MEITEDIIYFWLSVSGLSARRANTLLLHYSPKVLWEETGRTLTNPALFGEKVYEALLRYRNEEFLQRGLDKLNDLQISFVTRRTFPEPLLQPSVDPPYLLYCRGDEKLMHSNCVAIVGTRACSGYGRDAAKRLVTDLCNYNVTIVSGLATGIDTYAHRAAIDAHGKTIAVLGSGLNNVAPTSNLALFNDVIDSGGLVLSEYLPNAEATHFTFPERNRIVSGLSQGVVVVEAGLKSGALITADLALEQDRHVFAVPSNITNVKAVGSNRLLYEGATPALTAEDICDTLNYAYGKIERKEHAEALDIFEQKIYNILIDGACDFDTLVEKTEIAPPRLSALLSAMEIKGVIAKKQANTYALAF